MYHNNLEVIMKMAKSVIAILFMCGLFVGGYADETTVWQGYVSSSGQDTESITLEPGSTYVIEVGGTMDFGVNYRNDNQLIFDACYEFNSWGRPDFVPVYRNSLGIPVCKGVYEGSHVYKSDPFVANQATMTMSIFDTDYRDNSGSLKAKVVKVAEEKTVDASATDFGEGFFVMMTVYQPNVDEELANLEEGEKPSQYLKSLDPAKVKWEPSENPMVLFVPSDYAEQRGWGKSWWSKGKKAFIPLSFKMITTSEEEGEQAFEVDGGLLVEVAGTAANYSSLVELYPGIEEQGGKESVIPLGEDGTFAKEEDQDMGHISAKGGPIEPSSNPNQWDEEQYKQGMKFIWEIYEMMGCFVATAIYEVPSAPQLTTLREFRDKVLMTSEAGRRLVSHYYHLGPHWAQQVRENEWAQMALRPIVGGFAYALSWVDMENEYVQGFFHGVVSVIDWVAQPWLEEETQETGLLTPTEVLP